MDPSNGLDVLSTFMYTTNTLRTSVPHDHVYGILGVLTDVEPNEFTVNYELPLVEVYAELMRIYMTRYKSLRFLCFARLDKPMEDTPSWLPRPEKDDKLLTVAGGMSLASGEVDASAARIHSRGRALDVHGVLVDRISSLGKNKALNGVKVRSWMQEFEDMFSQSLRSTDSQHCVQNLSNLVFPPWKEDFYRIVTGRAQFTCEGQRRALKILLGISRTTDGETLKLSKLVWREVPSMDRIYRSFGPACAVIANALTDRKFLATENNGIGLINLSNAQIGDEIWIIFGCSLPAVLRPLRNRESGYVLLDVVDIPSLRNGEVCAGISINRPLVKAITIW